MRYSSSSNKNYLYYGDNLEVLRKYVPDESVDLCYIDPPFNSKRNYNQIYNGIGQEDTAQAQAFIDTWVWNERADEGYDEIINNPRGVFPSQTIALISGLREVLGKDSLLAYLISMTLRIAEIYRVLKPTGSFYLHCDCTSSHYLKLVIDSIFCTQGGDFRNEIIWYYYNKMHDRRKKLFARATDTLFFYVKNLKEPFVFHQLKEMRDAPIKQLARKKVDGKLVNAKDENGKVIYNIKEDKTVDNVWRIPCLQPASQERLGYDTQKPEALLERIIQASTNEGDVILDAFCGCGTSVAVAQKLNRRWIGIDITFQAISLIMKRLEKSHGAAAPKDVVLAGIPRDLASAQALANKQDDRVRKEFEKWAVLTYSNNRASLNEKKGADRGIDGNGYFIKAGGGHGRIIFQVKSGKVGSKDIRDLAGTMTREGAEMAVFITLKKPTSDMLKEAASYTPYRHELMGRNYPAIQIVTIEEVLKGGQLNIPLSLEVIRSPKRVKADSGEQMEMDVFSNEAAG